MSGYARRMGGKSIGGLIGCLVIAAGCACTGGASSGGRSSPLPAEPESNGDATVSVDAGMNGGRALSSGGTASADAAAVPGATMDATMSAAGPDAGPLASPAIHYLGRFDTRDPAGPRFAWPGSAIAATFRGTGIQVTLSDTGTNYFVVVVDGGAPKALATSGDDKTYTLASNLANGQHTVMLTKRTESNVGVVQLLALTPVGGALVPLAGAVHASDRIRRRLDHVRLRRSRERPELPVQPGHGGRDHRLRSAHRRAAERAADGHRLLGQGDVPRVRGIDDRPDARAVRPHPGRRPFEHLGVLDSASRRRRHQSELERLRHGRSRHAVRAGVRRPSCARSGSTTRTRTSSAR